MNTNYLSLDYEMSLSFAASAAMARSAAELYDFIVITKKEKYLGVVTIKDLLNKIAELELSLAKNQNPLTGLAGNLIIEQKLKRRISSEDPFSVAYLDIDNFKSYNDVYGFENGDLVIKLLAKILESVFLGTEFIGHIGGDDFVVIVRSHVSESYFEDIKKQFESKVAMLYDKNDINNGFIITKNRHGEEEKYPLMTLTIVVLSNNNQAFENVNEFTEKLALFKKEAKILTGVKQMA